MFSLLQSSESHNPSEILICWFTAQERFIIIIINVKNGFAASYFCENADTFFWIIWWVETEIFCNILNVCTITFDQFNVSLMNKSIHFLKKNYWPQYGNTYNKVPLVKMS